MPSQTGNAGSWPMVAAPAKAAAGGATPVSRPARTGTNDRDAGVPTEEGDGRDHYGQISNGSPIVDAEQ
jgi:hypothetical protein